MLQLPRSFLLRQFSTFKLSPTTRTASSRHSYSYQLLRNMATPNSNVVEKHALFICDIQEGFRNAIHEFPSVISTAAKLLQASIPLQIPIVVTEQNPNRLGATVPELTSLFNPPLLLLPVLPKSRFSMALPQVIPTLRQQNITAVGIVGIESHVCVLQTCLDLLKAGFEVYAISDGISSCNKEEVPIAIARMRQEGVKVTTSESWLYEVMGDAERPEFKEVLKVVKATLGSTREGLRNLCKSSL